MGLFNQCYDTNKFWSQKKIIHPAAQFKQKIKLTLLIDLIWHPKTIFRLFSRKLEKKICWKPETQFFQFFLKNLNFFITHNISFVFPLKKERITFERYFSPCQLSSALFAFGKTNFYEKVLFNHLPKLYN